MSNKQYEEKQKLRLDSHNYNKELLRLDLDQFPIIEDFEVITEDCGEYLGIHVYFYSSSIGDKIASFPWWDHADQKLKEMNSSDIPLGSITDPFTDLEQSWQILIWEKQEYVYVLEGGDPLCTEFFVWFKVDKQKYLNAWEALIKKYQGNII